MTAIDYSKRIYCLITGSSRGIGRTIAVELAQKAQNHLTLVLLARSTTGLLETKAIISTINKNVGIHTIPCDLSVVSLEFYQKTLETTFDQSINYESAIIFHNAGYIGSIQNTIDLNNTEEWKRYFDMNFISVPVLNSAFLKKTTEDQNVIVVNITSLIGRKAFKYLCMYGCGKAARDHYFKTLALEQPNITVLNYSPGMVETSMSNELVTNIKDFRDSEILASIHENPTKLTPEQTVQKMFLVLEQAKFQSGDIIDYYD